MHQSTGKATPPPAGAAGATPRAYKRTESRVEDLGVDKSEILKDACKKSRRMGQGN